MVIIIIVNTNLRKAQGYSRRGVIKFKGIPYAEPPIGDLRFKEPIPKDSWSGVLDATEYGPIAPQPPPPDNDMGYIPRKQSEAECLTLNIGTSGIEGELRPVMVWIHGGGFVSGNGADFDGARLVLKGDVVVVTINYRLGPLGFLYIPGKTANVGLLDQIIALKWVKDNIHIFGGDPDNITIFGESAGGISICALLTMPAAKGLFHKTIAQSGAVHPSDFTPSRRKEATEILMSNLDIKSDDIDELRRIPIKELIEADPTRKTIESGEILYMDMPVLGPVIEENTLPTHPLDKIRNGYAKEIELLIGSNLDEFKSWTAVLPKFSKVDEQVMYEQIYRYLNALGKDINKAEILVRDYKNIKSKRNLGSTRELLDAICSDYAFRVPSIRFAELQSKFQPNTYMYLFNWKSPMFGGRFGACHALEVAFVFGRLPDKDFGLHPSKNKETETLSNNMMNAWISFARKGNPNHEGLPEWPQYSVDKRSTMVFHIESKVINAPYDKERVAWYKLFF
ncbi:MAG: Para-nitrobenzyl esterase [Candidatus Lokiarchaeum sp. GC14_75]|nr:MAG: Para-nitrobenzyl esterase [Candidatus Lokiarchaeum sp. GC14_75]HEC40266.1 carboxylesterase/lipase family protein [bacterium]